MNKSFWGYVVIVLGVIAIVLIWNFTQITNLDQHNYNLLKETVESAMLDSVDISAYRKDGTVKIIEEKFVENFIRRFAESAELSNVYEIEIYDVNETPPKVSLKVTSYRATDGGIEGADTIFTISNNIDAILETRYTEELNTYKLTYKDGGTECDFTTAPYNTAWGTLCTPKKPGYTFNGWYVGNTKLTGEEIATKDITATADWNIDKYILTYDDNGGNSCSAKTKTRNYNQSWGTLCTPRRDGYDFLGWYTHKTSGVKITGATKATGNIKNLKVYAHWKKKATWTGFATTYCNTTTYPTSKYDKESKNQYQTRTKTPVYTYHFYKDYYTSWSDSSARPATNSSLIIAGGPYTQSVIASTTYKYVYFRYYGSVSYVAPKYQNSTPNKETYITSNKLSYQRPANGFSNWNLYGWADYGSGPTNAWFIEGNNNVPTYPVHTYKTQYRYLMRQYVSSSSSTYSGYTHYSTTTNYTYGSWGTWVDGTQTASDTVQTRTVCRVREK